jgi:hypothetical protein
MVGSIGMGGGATGADGGSGRMEAKGAELSSIFTGQEPRSV